MFEEIRKLSQHFLKLKNSPYRRYFIQKDPFKHRLSLVLGQRGVGKTTTLVQHLLDQTEQDFTNTSILYVQVDHFQVSGLSLYEIAEQFDTLGGKILALDEIHKYPNWSQELKSIYDTFPKLKLIVSGSSALQMHKGSHDLARRAIKYHLYGLSFREFIELCHQIKLPTYSLEDILSKHEKIAVSIISELEKNHKKVIQLFQEYLKFGYYPYFFEINDKDLYLLTLEQNLHTTIESDLVALHPHLTGTSIQKIKQLLSFIAKAVPFTPNWTKLKQTLEIGDIRTLKTYFGYLEDAYLIRTISKGNKKLIQIGAPEKVYLDNPNQMNALSAGDFNPGTLREIFFLNMVSVSNQATLASQGDFLVNGKYHFEIGGRSKKFEQIQNVKDAFLVCDPIQTGIGARLPLWLFGFLY